MIYLDHAATSPLNPAALEAMLPFLTNAWGNPASKHEAGRMAAIGLEAARQDVAAVLNCQAYEVFFTSGATEANNTVVSSIAQEAGSGLALSRIEHKSILEPAQWHSERGLNLYWLDVDLMGRLNLDSLRAALELQPAWVSVMYANNEVGTVQPIAEVAELCRANGVRLHCDAVQAPSQLSLDVQALGVDALSLSAHKFGGPKGIGVLFARSGTSLRPLLLGGGQESGMRSGTPNVAGAVGASVALQLAEAARNSVTDTEARRNRLINATLSSVSGALLVGSKEDRLAGHAAFAIPGINGETLLIELESAGVLCSSGSACDSQSTETSHVLSAMGIPEDLARTTVRFSLAASTNDDEIHRATLALLRSVKRLRAQLDSRADR